MSTDQKPAVNVSVQTRHTFAALQNSVANDGEHEFVDSKFLVDFMARNGLLEGDLRLNDFFGALRKLNALDENVRLDLEAFNDVTHNCSTLIHKCVTGGLRVPDFETVVDAVKEIYEKVLPNESGINAQYIPQLAKVNPDQFAISITTVDGQHFSIGESDVDFCIQSCSKPLSYLMAIKEFGPDYVHRHVGTEPSGVKFNEMVLKPVPEEDNPNRAIPHNPMINAGAMMAVSMVYPDMTSSERLDTVVDTWKQLTAGYQAPVHVCMDTYRSESATADRNWCLGYMMKERSAFPEEMTSMENGLGETLELYFQICSIMTTNRGMANVAATLANGGLNPITGTKIFEPDHVRCVLPLMFTAGMYDYSGQWSYDIGVPAKSGVGGCVFLVIPNVCGISIWSPRLDPIGNSARGCAVAKELCDRFSFHNFEVFSGLSRKKTDVTMRKYVADNAMLGDLLMAALNGDTAALRSMEHAGGDLFCSDYDCRTPLHLAASEGHPDTLRFLIEQAVETGRMGAINATDRWGGTPLDDATRAGSLECVEMLKKAGAQHSRKAQETAGLAKPPGIVGSRSTRSLASMEKMGEEAQVTNDAPLIILAAANNDLDELIKYAAMGQSLFVADYDNRTPLHLAAANGHVRIVEYLLCQACNHGYERAALSSKDRFGNTPLDDAAREGHNRMDTFLRNGLAKGMSRISMASIAP